MRVRGWASVLVIMLALGPAVAMALQSSSITAASFGSNTTDALLFRSTAELLVAGVSPYDAAAQARNLRDMHLGGAAPPFVLPFLYPPNALPMFALYELGSPRFGFVLFTACGTLLLLVAVYAVMGQLGHAEGECQLGVLGVGLGGATLFDAQLGQTGAFAAALSLLAGLALLRSSEGGAGVWLGLLAFKPQYAVFLAAWPLARRQVKTLRAAAMTVAATSLLAGALFGWGRFREFAEAIVSPNMTAPNMANWFALVHPVLRDVVVPSPGLAAAVTVLGIGVAVIGCLFVGRRGGDALDGLGLSAAAALFASPSTHPYDLGLWVLPLLALARAARARHAGVVIAIASIAVHPFLRPDLRFVLALGSAGLAVLVVFRAGGRFQATAPEARR